MYVRDTVFKEIKQEEIETVFAMGMRKIEKNWNQEKSLLAWKIRFLIKQESCWMIWNAVSNNTQRGRRYLRSISSIGSWWRVYSNSSWTSRLKSPGLNLTAISLIKSTLLLCTYTRVYTLRLLFAMHFCFFDN